MPAMWFVSNGNEEIIKLVVVSQSRSFENNFFIWRPLKHFVGEECRNKIVGGIVLTKYPQPMNKLPTKS